MLPKHRPRSHPYSGEEDRGMGSLILLSGLACDFVHSRAGCKIHNAFTVLVLQSQWRTRQRSCFACYLLSCVSHDVFGRLDIRLLAAELPGALLCSLSVPSNFATKYFVVLCLELDIVALVASLELRRVA